MDLAALQTVLPEFHIPQWSSQVTAVAYRCQELLDSDYARDLSLLRSLPRQPLRDLLSPIGKRVPLSQEKIIRASRALLCLVTLAEKGEFVSGLTSEFALWLAGKFPQSLTNDALTPKGLAALSAENGILPGTVKVLNHMAHALVSELQSPFECPKATSTVVVARKRKEIKHDANHETVEGDESVPAKGALDYFLAEQATASRRAFSGVPSFDVLHPFELEMIWQKVLELNYEEILVAELALFLRILPSHYDLVGIARTPSRGLSLDLSLGAVRLDLRYVIDQKSRAVETSGADVGRIVAIPLPVEMIKRLKERGESEKEPLTLRDLFNEQPKVLHKTVRAALRKISISSHRVTLSRLANSFGIFALRTCRDETYASVASLDFNLGTTANFNYLTIRGKRFREILRTCHKQLGYSGKFFTEQIPDVISPRLPSPEQVEKFVKEMAEEVIDLIASTPRHCSIERLSEIHNRIARNVYALFKFLSGTRPLEVETVTGSQLDLANLVAGIIDKRVSPYHTERFVRLSKYLIFWLETYLSWLRLVAYRLAGSHPQLAALIHQTTTSTITDAHPLFFVFDGSDKTIPIGMKDIQGIFSKYGIYNNGGRHWVDATARDASIDSASVMSYAGRGLPGQELFGRWSAAIPSLAFKSVAAAIDSRIEFFQVPAAPILAPRRYRGMSSLREPIPYLPPLLATETSWSGTPLPNSFGAPEPCPMTRSSIYHIAQFENIFRTWRASSPPEGWLGVALSLILEDAVVHHDELFGAIAEISAGTIYIHDELVFVDSCSKSLAIRRTFLSSVTLQLSRKIERGSPFPTQWSDFDTLFVGPSSAITLAQAMACTESFFSFNSPACLSSWSKGLIFARTTRPAAVARHLLGRIEPPMFDLRRKARFQPCPSSIADALSKAKIELQGGASHQTALCVLRKDLLEMERAENSAAVRMTIGFLIYLTETLSNVDTAVRYESGARNFIRLAAEAIEEFGLSDEIDWRGLAVRALEGRQDESAPDQTAVNLALAWLGIDIHVFQRCGAPPTAKKYAENLSQREIDAAESIFRTQSGHPGDDRHLAAFALRLLAAHPARWDEIAHLRICDVAIHCDHPHFVISEETGARLKSDNAPRAVQINDPVLLRDLRLIVKLRQARFPGDDLVPIFGDASNPRTIQTSDRVHRLMTEALWRATGSPFICVHDLRHFAITRQISKYLRPGAESTFDTLQLRQGLIACSIDAGHCWPEVSVENYGHDFEILRTQHFKQKINKLTPPSDRFLAAVTGVSEHSLRKRRSRDPKSGPVLWEGFSWQGFPHRARLVFLGSFVSPNQCLVGTSEEEIREQELLPKAIYLGSRLLGDSPSESRLLCGLAEDEARPVDDFIRSSPQRNGRPLTSRQDLNRKKFLDALTQTRLVIAMQASTPTREITARIERSIHSLGDEWCFVSAHDALDIAPWLQVWRANGIATELLVRPSGRSLLDSHILDEARQNGFVRARTLPARHFPRRCMAMLRFFSDSDHKANSSKPRASPQITFLVSICALSIHLSPSGASNHVAA